ncbi:1-acyl-sn-glycerol-3-phosphate acyltransferase, partial [Vibrio echinoideorum]
SIQTEVKKSLLDTLAKTTIGVTYTGLESLDANQSYLFVSNQREIAIDPALVNYAFHQKNHKKCRIAIGDNL